MSDESDVECIRKGEYLVIKNTIVAIHESDPRILGIVVQIDGEWILTVPTKPTKDMLIAAKEYNYDLPIQVDTLVATVETVASVAPELQSLHHEISTLQRSLSAMEDIKVRIKKVQGIVQDVLA